MILVGLVSGRAEKGARSCSVGSWRGIVLLVIPRGGGGDVPSRGLGESAVAGVLSELEGRRQRGRLADLVVVAAVLV